jgi:hypothetical protein
MRAYLMAHVVVSDNVSITSAELLVGRPCTEKPLMFWAELRAKLRTIEVNAIMQELALKKEEAGYEKR